jgi:hypothetical protein
LKYWEIIADKLSKAGWSLGWVSVIDSEGRTIRIVDAHRDNGKRSASKPRKKTTECIRPFFPTAFSSVTMILFLRKRPNQSLEPAASRISPIRLKSNRQNSPHLLLEKKLNDCGELGIKRGLNPAGVL